MLPAVPRLPPGAHIASKVSGQDAVFHFPVHSSHLTCDDFPGNPPLNRGVPQVRVRFWTLTWDRGCQQDISPIASFAIEWGNDTVDAAPLPSG